MNTAHKKTTRILFVIGFIAIGLALFTGYRYAQRNHNRPLPRRRETNVTLIQGWMSLPLVAHTYRIPETLLYERLEVEPREQMARIDTIAKNHNESSIVFLDRVKVTVKSILDEPRTIAP